MIWLLFFSALLLKADVTTIDQYDMFTFTIMLICVNCVVFVVPLKEVVERASPSILVLSTKMRLHLARHKTPVTQHIELKEEVEKDVKDISHQGVVNGKDDEQNHRVRQATQIDHSTNVELCAETAIKLSTESEAKSDEKDSRVQEIDSTKKVDEEAETTNGPQNGDRREEPAAHPHSGCALSDRYGAVVKQPIATAAHDARAQVAVAGHSTNEKSNEETTADRPIDSGEMRDEQLDVQIEGTMANTPPREEADVVGAEAVPDHESGSPPQTRRFQA